ncbi:TetR/AcrR family transcriptional regulator [Tepidibacillus sp. LV47]|uniref:TetR/AcrR family transcriptional regulator n=1 Tax=Tepidibacillus sp. LV47 TaxID=3398228 RepID=UPI003AAB2106
MADHTDSMSKREIILKSAFQVFTEKGFHSAKVSDVAELAKVGKGTVYEYFASKEDLLRGVIEAGIKYYIQKLNEQVKDSVSPWEKIRKIIKKHGEMLRSGQNFSQLMFENFGVMTKEFHQFLIEQRQGIMQIIQNILKEGIELGQIKPISLELGARMILGMMIAIHCEDQCLSDEAIDEMIATIEQGLLL